MGVIYKLKEDVLAFIIDQKKKDPSLSIRRLAILTGEKFQIDVSKSSVSTALKNASLNSAVGRRAKGDSAAAKFAIPQNRKTEISKNMQKAGFVKSEESKKKDESDKVKEAQLSVNDEKKEKEPSLMPDLLEKKKPASTSIIKEKVEQKEIVEEIPQNENYLEHVGQLRERKKSRKKIPISGAGYIFLKAAQWESSTAPLMSGLFKKYISGPSEDSFNVACDMFLYLKYLGVHTFENVSSYKDHGLLQFSKSPAKNFDENETMLKLKELLQWSRDITNEIASGIVMEYDLEKKYIFSEASGFELQLEDGQKLTIDAAISPLGTGIKAPINKTVAWLSNYLISNVHSPVFFKAPGTEKFDKTFYDLVAIFENFSGKKIQEVSVLDKNSRQIAKFSTIPAQRRSFLIGIAPEQKDFAHLTKNIKWAKKKPYYHQESDHIIYYGEARTNGLAGQYQEQMEDLRIVAIWEDKDKDPFWAVLTNQNEGGSEDILKAYMSRWPYFDWQEKSVSKDGSPGAKERLMGDTALEHEELTFQGIFSDFTRVLNQCAQRYYFPNNYFGTDVNEMDQKVYGISGSVCEGEDYLAVLLEIPEASPHRQDIEYALRCVNERYIFDNFNRRLWIEIQK